MIGRQDNLNHNATQDIGRNRKQGTVNAFVPSLLRRLRSCNNTPRLKPIYVCASYRLTVRVVVVSSMSLTVTALAGSFVRCYKSLLTAAARSAWPRHHPERQTVGLNSPYSRLVRPLCSVCFSCTTIVAFGFSTIFAFFGRQLVGVSRDFRIRWPTSDENSRGCRSTTHYIICRHLRYVCGHVFPNRVVAYRLTVTKRVCQYVP